MSKELTKKSDYKISKLGNSILDLIRDSWGKLPAKRKKTVLVKDQEGNERMKFEEIEVEVDTPIKRINQNYPTKIFYEFASLVTEEDKPRIERMIQKKIFDVSIANKCFKSMSVALDKKVKPKTWKDSDDLRLPSINTVAIYKGKEYIEDIIFQMLVRLNKKFGKRSDLDTELIEELAEEISTNYRSFTVSDFKYMFYHLEKSSKKLFNLDYQIVIQLLEEGLEDKSKYWEEENTARHKSFTYDEKMGRQREPNKARGSISDQESKINTRKIIEEAKVNSKK